MRNIYWILRLIMPIELYGDDRFADRSRCAESPWFYSSKKRGLAISNSIIDDRVRDSLPARHASRIGVSWNNSCRPLCRSRILLSGSDYRRDCQTRCGRERSVRIRKVVGDGIGINKRHYGVRRTGKGIAEAGFPKRDQFL